MPVAVLDDAERTYGPRRPLCVALVAVALGLLSACGVVDAAGSVAGGAVDLTVDAVDTTTDVVTAPL